MYSIYDELDRIDDAGSLNRASTPCGYRVKRYGQWHWGVLDSNNLFMKKEDGKLLLFKSKNDAVAHVNMLCNGVLTESYEIDGEEVTWPEYFDYQMEVDEYFMDDNMFDEFAEKAYKLVEEHGYTDVFTETSTQAGRGGDFFWAKKNGISYRGVFDFETEQKRFYDAAVSANSFEEAIDAIAKCYAKIILDSLKPVEEALVEEASEIYYLQLFSKDGRTFEQSFSTYQEAEDEGKFSLENNPMTKEYIIYDKNHKRIKHKR